MNSGMSTLNTYFKRRLFHFPREILLNEALNKHSKQMHRCLGEPTLWKCEEIRVILKIFQVKYFQALVNGTSPRRKMYMFKGSWQKKNHSCVQRSGPKLIRQRIGHEIIKTAVLLSYSVGIHNPLSKQKGCGMNFRPHINTLSLCTLLILVTIF